MDADRCSLSKVIRSDLSRGALRLPRVALARGPDIDSDDSALRGASPPGDQPQHHEGRGDQAHHDDEAPTA